MASDGCFLDLKLMAEPKVLKLMPDESFGFVELVNTDDVDAFSFSSLRPDEKERMGRMADSFPVFARDHHDDLAWVGGRRLGGMRGKRERVCISPRSKWGSLDA